MRGKHVRLEPLSLDHASGLFEVTRDPDIWTWLLSSQPSVVDTRALFSCVDNGTFRF